MFNSYVVTRRGNPIEYRYIPGEKQTNWSYVHQLSYGKQGAHLLNFSSGPMKNLPVIDGFPRFSLAIKNLSFFMGISQPFPCWQVSIVEHKERWNVSSSVGISGPWPVIHGVLTRYTFHCRTFIQVKTLQPVVFLPLSMGLSWTINRLWLADL